MTGDRCVFIIFLRDIITGRCLTGTGSSTPQSAVKVVGGSLDLVYSTAVILFSVVESTTVLRIKKKLKD